MHFVSPVARQRAPLREVLRQRRAQAVQTRPNFPARPVLFRCGLTAKASRGIPSSSNAIEPTGPCASGKRKKRSCPEDQTTAGGIGVAIVSELNRSDAAQDVMEGCMAQRGYAYVDERQADKAQADFRTNAETVAHQQSQGLATGSIGK